MSELDCTQLNKYADDITKLYKLEKERIKSLTKANQQLQKYAEALNKSNSEIKKKDRELSDAYLDTIHRLSLAAEYKDEDTGDHIIRISHYSKLMAELYGLPEKDVRYIEYAAPMHDIGKIGIPDNILLKPSKLDKKEFSIIQTHTSIGANILSSSSSEYLQAAEKVALGHHEKYNGKGYPNGLKGIKIPLSCRIVTIVDVFDALISKRPYKEAFPIDRACNIIRAERGEQFDPDLVDLLLANLDKFLKIRNDITGVKI